MLASYNENRPHMQQAGVGRLNLGPLLKCAARQFREHDMATHAAAVTFYVLFSFFPFLIVFITLLGVLELSELFDWLRYQSQSFFLPQTVGQINQILDQLQQRRIGMLSFGVIAALWVTSYGMLAVMNALNVVYGVKEGRSLWKRYLLSLLFTLIIGSLLVTATMLVVAAPKAIQAIAQGLGMEKSVALVWTWWLRWPIVLCMLMAAVTIVYGVAPDVEQRFRFITPGAVVAVSALMGISLIYDFYIRHIVEINALYGSVGTIIALLIYFFLAAIILLFGAEVNAVIECRIPTGKNAGDKTLP